MKNIIISLLATLFISSCAIHGQTYGPSGSVVNTVNCPASSCYSDIGEVCGEKGYTIIKETKHHNVFRMHVFSDIVYKCGGTRSNVASNVTENDAVISGTSFFINNDGYLITNNHVIENCRNTALGYKSTIHPAKIIAKDQVLDLALLKVDIESESYLKLSKSKPEKLQRIIAAGYPFGKYISNDLKFTSGVISSLKGPADDSTRLQVDAALNPGNSGGPIVDEESGLLIAVSVAGLSKEISESIAFGIKASSVIDFLNSNNVEYSTSTPTINPGRGSLAESLESSIGYVTCN